MKLLLPVLISCLLFSSCQRKTASSADESKTSEKEIAVRQTDRSAIDKELRYQEISPQSKEALMKMPISGTPEQDFKSLYESGYQKHNAGDFKGAIADFSKCIAQNPEYSEAWNFRGMAKYKSGDSSGACSDWRKANELGNNQAQNMVEQYCK